MKQTHTLLTLLLLAISINAVFSQKQYVIEDAVLECQYKLTVVKDTLNRSQVRSGIYTLRVGEDISQFYNQTHLNSMSLSVSEVLSHLDKAISTNNFSSLPGAKTTVEYLYKNYPQGKITTTTILLADPFLYEEEMEKQNWIIGDSIKMIYDFKCQKAVCSFRGRQWTVWFATDIPISDGPWKFHGLPGLILEAYDTHKDYHYIIEAVKQNNIPPLTFYKIRNKPFEKTDRKTFLKAKHRVFFSSNPIQDVEAATGIDLSEGKVTPPREKKHNYHFIERDNQ